MTSTVLLAGASGLVGEAAIEKSVRDPRVGARGQIVFGGLLNDVSAI